MKKQILPLSLLAAASLALSACSGGSARQTVSFNQGWLFSLKTDSLAATSTKTDDSSWRQLNLPHDWSIEADFSPKYPAGVGGGALPGGMGWYRKHFKVPATDKDKAVYLEFDGIYRDSRVWLNGHLLGYRPYGYISFRYELSPYLNYGGDNLLVVQVDNTQQPNSRWYSGSGIYRNTRLVTSGKVHVAYNGTYVTTPEITADKARLKIQTTLRNELPGKAVIELTTIICDPQGRRIAQTRTKGPSIDGNASSTFTQELSITNPQLWSTDKPLLYTALTEVKANGRPTDTYSTTFGLRTFKWEPKTGFYLNGKNMKILGVCLHHDLGCLGAAVNYSALERELRIMKEMGVNAIRTSHNPPAPELLDICDHMGLLVMDEAFDMWKVHKTKYDYASDFGQWAYRDIADQVRRDRNHPSVFMWSIGNEIPEQSAVVDGQPTDQTIAPTLARIVHQLDPTRVTTSACNEPDTTNMIFKSGAVDIYGFNYHHTEYAKAPRYFPGKTFIVTESTSALASRGDYQMPSDSIFVEPTHWPYNGPDGKHICSAYDNCHVPWGSTHEATWREVKRLPYISGMFIWTGFDYLGEPTPYGWPSRSSFFGIVDLAGFPKDVYYMYQSEWTDKPVLHLFPDWNWNKGDTVDVWAYYNHADAVELFLNGKSLGQRQKSDSVFHVCWRVPYQPGTLKAVSLKDGKEVLEQEIHTAGPAAKMVLTADRHSLKTDGTDMAFVSVQIEDKDGNPVPHADNLIKFSVEGPGYIAGTDNGCENDSTSLKRPERHAYNGKALAVVGSKGQSGLIRLKATSEGLPDETVEIKAD
ncbi:MAG: DUF4982 domain-containing protein [Tannerella sp.]|jgi:beta-galactosidase|nr:DUF4982 domain-containing protein [Tannerella sp.]